MKTGWWLILGAAALEFSHAQVASGAAATHGNTVASLEGQLANVDEITGANLHLGYILGAIGIWMLVK